MYCRVLLDGEVLFSFMPEDVHRWDRSKSSGFIYKSFPLPRDYQGKLLQIQLLPPMTVPMGYGLPDLFFGDYTPVLRQATLHVVPHDVTIILCVLMGLVPVLFSTLSLRGSNYREGISIGVFALLFSLYLITECKTLCYLMGHPYHTYLLNYMPFSLMPNALLGFMRERLPERHRRLCTFAIKLGSVCFPGELFLHFTGILDMRELIAIIHMFYFAFMALVLSLITTMEDKRRKKSLILQLTPALCGMLLGGLIYWSHWEIGSNDATFTILGVTLFLIVEFVHAFRSGVAVYTESVRIHLYRRMAFVDELTGLGNRRAYDLEIDRVATGERCFRSMIVVSAGVNRLKYVNDHFGHAAGDQLIQGSAQILQQCAEDRSKVFRTGGDEFAAFLYDVDLDRFRAMAEKAQEGMEAFSREHEFPLRLPAGYVALTDNKIPEAVQEADRLMYENKARMKQEDAALNP